MSRLSGVDEDRLPSAAVLSLSLCFSVSVCLSLCVSISHTHTHTLGLETRVSLSVCLSVSLCLYHTHTHTHTHTYTHIRPRNTSRNNLDMDNAFIALTHRSCVITLLPNVAWNVNPNLNMFSLSEAILCKRKHPLPDSNRLVP